MTFWVAGAAIAAPMIGGMMASDSAQSGIDAQTASAAQSDATQRYMYDTTRADNSTFLKNGTNSNNQLAYLMGIGGANMNAPDVESFIRGSTGADYDRGYRLGDNSRAQIMQGAVDNYKNGDYGNSDAALKLFGYQAGDSSYGSLNRKFSVSDLAADVPYQTGMQFGLDQGVRGINNQASATGSLLSGATLKALTQFGNDYGNQKAGEAYNRYTQDNTNTYNKLAGIAGAGQTSAAQVGSAGQSYANNVSQTAQGLGNARAASGIASGNALGSGITGAYNNYQSQQLINKLPSYAYNPGGTPYNVGSDPYSGYNSSIGL